MVRKIGIIGMGNVGSTIAHGLITKGICDDYVFIDKNEKKVKADALDFRDALANLDYHANIIVNEYQSLEDADIVVISFGNISLQKNSQGDRFAELSFTAKQVPLISEKLKEVNFKGILVVISNPVDVVTSLFQHHTQFPKNRIIGTGTLLDTARMKRVVSEYFNIDPRSVYGYNLGEHGNSQFTAWSNVLVEGKSITGIISKEELERMEDESRKGGFTVFSGTDYTNYGIASATIRLIQSIFTDSKEEMVVSHYNNEYGIYTSSPLIVGREGIVEEVELQLSEAEWEQFKKSAEYIKEKFDNIWNKESR